MRAGYLRQRIEIQKLDDDQQDEAGGFDETWVTVCETWASVEPLKGSEYLAGREVDSQVSTRIRTRQRKDVVISSDMRVLFGSRVFEIESVIDVYTRGRELQLMCRELLG